MVMSNINKGTATIFHTTGKPYTSISNAVVDSINNPDSLAIWTFLQTKDSGWKVLGNYLQDKFNLGRKRYSDAMAYLEKMGLVQYDTQRNELGQVLGKRIIVNYEPVPTELPENPQFGQPTVRSTHTSVNRQQPIKDSILIKDNTNDDVESAFAIYWSAGMLKTNKKKALSSFASYVKANKLCPTEFANMLAKDVKARLSANQMGFDRMHPTTYLNGERWEDQIVQNHSDRDKAQKPVFTGQVV